MAYEEIEKESIGCLLRFLKVAVAGGICLILANYFFVIRPFMNEMFVAFSKSLAVLFRRLLGANGRTLSSTEVSTHSCR